MTFLGDVFTGEDTLNPVRETTQNQGFPMFVLHIFTVCTNEGE